MASFRTRFSPSEMVQSAHVQRLIGRLYALRYCYIPSCRFTAQSGIATFLLAVARHRLRWQQACVQAANTLTALPNGRYVNVRMERMRQGLELAQRGAVTLPDDGEDLSAVVRSGNNLYQVDTRLLTCSCADVRRESSL